MATRAEQRTARAQRDADRFNKKYPVGTEVRYWTGLREGEGKVSKTRARAAVMSDHASVWIEGVAGSVSLSHVEPVQKVRMTMSSESIAVVAVTAEDVKGYRRVKVRRTRRNGNNASIVFKEIRFAVGDFTTWPSGWAPELRGAARQRALQMIEKHPAGYEPPAQHPTDVLSEAIGD